MQEGTKVPKYAKKSAIWTGNFYLSPADCILVDFKKMIINQTPILAWFHFGRKQIYQEKKEAIRIAPKHNNNLKTFPYAIQKHLAMHLEETNMFHYMQKAWNQRGISVES